MGSRVLQCTLVFVILHLVSSVYVPYDCRRSVQVCGTAPSPGRCVSDTGRCECTDADYEGFDCTLRTDSIVLNSACNVNCGATGTCYSVALDPVHKCYCDAATFGENCESSRVSVECAGNSMVARVFPQSFAGEIYVTNLQGVPECTFDPAADGNGLLKNISFSEDNTKNPCSPNLSVATDSTDGTQIFTYEITVRYNPLYTSFVDEVHTITCRHTIGGPLIGTVIGVDGGPLDGVTIEGNINVIDLDVIRDSDKLSIVKDNIVVGVGEQISIQITLKESRYTNHRVENCGAYSHALTPPINPDRLEKPLVMNGCPAEGSLDVVRGPITKTGNVINLPLSTFKFSTGELHLFCSVRVCQADTESLCLPTDCPQQYGGPGTGFGRKKRQTGDDENIKIVQRRIFVVTSAEMNDSPGKLQQIIEESCLRSTAFLTITGVFAALLVIVLAVTIALVIKYNRREKTIGKGNYSDKS